VHPETRFWNAGGVDLTLGSQGLRIRANSWEQLLSGGIAFETPSEVLSKPPSPAGSVFGLYDNRRAADRAPLGPTLVYVADFLGNQRGLDTGTAVELQGVEVGEVTDAHLAYDDRAHTLVTRTTFYVDPERVQPDKFQREIGLPASQYIWHDLTNPSPVQMMEWWSTFSHTGVLGDPTLASQEKGARLYEVLIDRMVELIREMRARPVRERVDLHEDNPVTAIAD